MKTFLASLIAGTFALTSVTAFAAEAKKEEAKPAAKAEAKKEEAKPAKKEEAKKPEAKK